MGMVSALLHRSSARASHRDTDQKVVSDAHQKVGEGTGKNVDGESVQENGNDPHHNDSISRSENRSENKTNHCSSDDSKLFSASTASSATKTGGGALIGKMPAGMQEVISVAQTALHPMQDTELSSGSPSAPLPAAPSSAPSTAATLLPSSAVNSGDDVPVSYERHRLLLCAPSNAAVDELLLRLLRGVMDGSGRVRRLRLVGDGRSINHD